jgi:uncharacterized repeat protein (TIGR01451 family)
VNQPYFDLDLPAGATRSIPLTWPAATDAENDPIKYLVYLAHGVGVPDDPQCSQCFVTETSETNCLVPIDDDGTYSWTVLATNLGGASRLGTRLLKVDNTAPVWAGTPGVSQAVLESGAVTVAFGRAHDQAGVSYNLYYGSAPLTAATFTNCQSCVTNLLPTLSGVSEHNSYTSGSVLQAGKVYYFVVRAEDRTVTYPNYKYPDSPGYEGPDKPGVRMRNEDQNTNSRMAYATPGTNADWNLTQLSAYAVDDVGNQILIQDSHDPKLFVALGSITISAGDKVTIGAGETLQFDSSTGKHVLNALGTLMGSGTQDQRIAIRSITASPGAWQGITGSFRGCGGTVSLLNTTVEWAQTGISMASGNLALYDCTIQHSAQAGVVAFTWTNQPKMQVTIAHTTLTLNGGDGFSGAMVNGTIQTSRLQDNLGNGIGYAGGNNTDAQLLIQDNSIVRNVMDGIALSEASVGISYNFIDNNYGAGISMSGEGGGGAPLIQGNSISTNRFGCYVMDAPPKLRNNTITENLVYGFYVELSPAATSCPDLGRDTGSEAGGNTIHSSRSGIDAYNAKKGSSPVPAEGNTWSFQGSAPVTSQFYPADDDDGFDYCPDYAGLPTPSRPCPSAPAAIQVAVSGVQSGDGIDVSWVLTGPPPFTTNTHYVLHHGTNAAGQYPYTMAVGTNQSARIEAISWGTTYRIAVSAMHAQNGSRSPMSAEILVTIPPLADVGIVGVTVADEVTIGQTLEIEMMVGNSGPTPATGVTLTNWLPPSVDFVSAEASQGICTNQDGTVICNLGTLAAGTNATIRLVVVPRTNSWGVLSTSFAVQVEDDDPNPTNNTVTVTTLVVPEAPLITSQPGSLIACRGQPASFDATVLGESPLNYQWQFNGSVLVGATRTYYTLWDSEPGYAGEYRVVVTNAFGTVLSSNATLAVEPIAAWGAGTNNTGTRPYCGQCLVPPSLTDAVAIDAGGYHSLALMTNGRVAGWGYNFYGQTNAPAWLSNVVAIAVGAYHNLALRTDGTVVSWGDSSYGATSVPAGLGNVVAIDAGGASSLALKADGTVAAWGISLYGQTNVPPGLKDVVAIASGEYHNLALRRDSTVVAWGAGTTNTGVSPHFGQSQVPAGLSNVVAVVGGVWHSLALKSDGTVVAWGDNRGGQADVPPGLSNVVAIAAGCSNSLTLKADGTVVAWGANEDGQSNVPWWLYDVAQISAGRNHALALVGGAPQVLTAFASNRVVNAGEPLLLQTHVFGAVPLTYQWQMNGTNLPGANQPALWLNPVLSANAGTYRLLVYNHYGTAVSPEVSVTVVPVVAWGAGTNYTGTVPYFGQCILPATLTDVVEIDAGAYHGLGLTADGRVLGWGWNYYGQTNAPAWLSNVVAMAAGAYHNLALRSDGAVVAWGDRSYNATNVPPGLSNVVAVDAGGASSLVLKADGTVAAWGIWLYGQTNVPARLSNVAAIAAGEYHNLALRGDGTVVAWGAGTSNTGVVPHYGQSMVPAGLSNVVAVAGGVFHSLALCSDGTVVAWGRNDSGQTNVPADLNSVVGIAAGQYHSLALKADGSVVAWGGNSDGQTNVPVWLTNVTAIACGRNHSLALVLDAVTPLHLYIPTLAGETFRVSLPTERGKAYRLEYKDSLTDAFWKMRPPVPGDDSPRTLTNGTGGAPERFYRVRRQ